MIGKTVYIYDGNRRKYEDDDGNRISYPNPRFCYRPIEIVGENRVSWIGKNGEKVNKKTGALSGGGQFGLELFVKWSWQEVEDELEIGRIKRRIARLDVFNGLSLDQLRRIVAILDETPDA